VSEYRLAITVSRFVVTVYAAFFSFAHLARCVAAIFLRADADISRFTGAEPGVFAAAAGCDPVQVFAHRAF
jgi:hypothetical protein